ncbi:TPA: hypothetical protein N0F65_002650 [Lagenidium giganteum]|uniref:RNase H type-1 domain-containing protein n=1 Tax=Lagenidium giganteum TaxID=4803 RepID=A0AAV2Z8S4_9STRA|nr:TPA: hypothetical protein N0F65_002650 [Lagenidium giganteum]
MIIRQLSSRTPPKATYLRRRYAAIWSMTDSHSVASWSHHYRQYNKMTDSAANIALNMRFIQEATQLQAWG